MTKILYITEGVYLTFKGRHNKIVNNIEEIDISDYPCLKGFSPEEVIDYLITSYHESNVDYFYGSGFFRRNKLDKTGLTLELLEIIYE